jgi:uncharacterized protein YcgL (UPF0745 family)
MQIDIYQSSKSRTKFVSIKSGEAISSIKISDPDYKQATLYKQNVMIESNQPLLGLDTTEAIKAIEAQGYFLHSFSISFTENET